MSSKQRRGKRVVGVVGLVVGLALLGSVRADAAPCSLSSATCLEVAEFSWDFDELFGDTITIKNRTNPAGSLGTFADDLADVEIGFNGDVLENRTLLAPLDQFDAFVFAGDIENLVSAFARFFFGPNVYELTLSAPGTTLLLLETGDPVTPVPEPAHLALLALLGGACAAVRRRRS